MRISMMRQNYEEEPNRNSENEKNNNCTEKLFNIRLDKGEEWISERQDFQNQSEEQTEKRLKKDEESLSYLWDTIKQNTYIMEVTEEEREKGVHSINEE